MPNGVNRVFTIAYLIAVTMLDYIGLGIVITLFPKLILDPNLNMLSASWDYKARISIIGLFLAIYPLGQFFGAAILGKLSDYLGRQKILAISLLCTSLGFLASGLAIVEQSAVILFISRLLTGLFAGNASIAQASMVDISVEETKTRYFSYLQIALGVSFILGPLIGGWLSQSSLISWFTYSTPFWALSILSTILFIITLLIYKETLLNRRKEKINVFSGIMQIHHVFTKIHLRIVFIVWILFNSGWWLFDTFFPAHLMRDFNFTPAQIGNFIASMGATYALFQFFAVKNFSKSIAVEKQVKYSLILCGLSIISIFFVKSIWILHCVITIFVATMAFAIPGLTTCISNSSNRDEQGNVMGMAASLQALSTVIVMAFGGFLESKTQGLTIIGGGFLLIISWCIFTFKYRKAWS